MKKTFLCFAFVLFMLCAGRSVSAHATPISYEPESSSLVQAAPTRVRIHLSERIEPAASGISVLGPDGSHVETGNPSVDPADSRWYQIAMRDVGAGTYTVIWQVVSADDGHFTKGAFVFSVGKESVVQNSAAGQIQIQHITTVPEAAAIFLELFGQALLLGLLLALWTIWQPLRRRMGDASYRVHPLPISPDTETVFERRIAWAFVAGVVSIFAGIISVSVLKTFDLEQLHGTNFFATLAIFIRTLDGSHLLFRFGIAILCAVLFFFCRAKIVSRERISLPEKIFAVLVFLMVLSRARVSHSAATNFFPSLSVLITAVHLASKEIWIGGLAVFTMVLLPVVSRMRKTMPVIFSLTSFSRVISIIFGITGVTGCYIVWLDMKNPAYIFSTEWGARFILLLLLGAVLFLIRLYHQLVAEKSLHDYANSNDSAGGRQTPARPVPWIISRLPYGLALETCVGIALLGVTGFLIITTPPFPPERFSFERHLADQGARIELGIHPYEKNNFLVTVTDEKTGNPIPVSDLIVKLTNEEKGIGPLLAATKERFPGGYIFPRSMFSLPGVWHIAITALRPNAFDETASFSVDYPKDIESSRIDPEHRSFGWFESSLLAIAAGIGILALLLYRASGRLFKRTLSLSESSFLISAESDLALVDSMTGEQAENDKENKPRKFGISFLSNLKSWSFGVVGALLIFAGVWFSYGAFLETDFQKLCERDGNFWIQSVPMADGTALSSDTVTGCTLNIGLYHFADEREYAYFVRPRQSAAAVSAVPPTPIAGTPAQLMVTLSTIDQGKIAGPLEELGIYHDRILHMIIIGEDLKTFAHIHTEDLGPVTPEMKKSGVFPLRYVFPKAGHYTIVVNYIQGGRELSQQSFLDVNGEPKMEKYVPPSDRSDQVSVKNFDGYRVTLEKPDSMKAGEAQKLTYVIEKDGRPVTDLEPYLGASMHLAVARADLGRVAHTHGQVYLPGSAFFQQLFQSYVKYHSHFVPDHFGPKIQAQITFPQPGLYEIFGEFKVGEKVILTSFMVEAI